MWWWKKKAAIERRENTLRKLTVLGIGHCEGLPFVENSKLCKNETQICKRFISSLFFSLLACNYIQDRDYYKTEGKEITEKIIETFKLQDYLLVDEKKLLSGECDDHTAVNVSWTVECCYALAWVLGFVPTEEMEVADAPNSCDLFAFIQPFHNFDDFKASCHLRRSVEVMDMFDLYYNYHWACVDHNINPSTKCGQLNEEVVVERRKALEWLISQDFDWECISLNT